jgi:hypothetical protein
MGKRTPWGTSDHEKTYAPGIVFYGTPGHGGFHCDRARNALVHEAWRKPGGWYEEDCEWVIVALTFPEAFPAETVEHARAQAKNERPDGYTAVTGTALSLEESAELRSRAWYAAHENDYVATAAWGDWHASVPDGLVAVLAVRGVTKRGCHGEDEAYFLVPAAEYDTRDRHGFVVDEARHERCAPVTGCASKTRNRGAESASEGAA